ncbi:MAG TPA: GTP cyclohydrolase I [Pseudonocardiaceae bacterium]|jgi:GTP cyclohydrolase I|nr:GTP cyclohydrolase I [Pseudonocardiaceae bacterium]
MTDRRLHVAAEHRHRDLSAAQAGAHAFLTALGFDLDQEALSETPARMAKAYIELLTPREFDLATFPNDEGYEQLVLIQGIPFRSLCEHHALPFIGVADVGYLPDRRIIGLSKLARVVELFAHRAQVQERMTKQVADWLAEHLAPKGVGVVLRAEHLCMTLRGAQVPGTTTVTSALHGLLLHDARARHEFVTLTHPAR